MAQPCLFGEAGTGILLGCLSLCLAAWGLAVGREKKFRPVRALAAFFRTLAAGTTDAAVSIPKAALPCLGEEAFPSRAFFRVVLRGKGAEAWRANRAAKGDVEAWMDANAANHAWNACAIDRNRYVYFGRLMHLVRFRVEVKREDW